MLTKRAKNIEANRRFQENLQKVLERFQVPGPERSFRGFRSTFFVYFRRILKSGVLFRGVLKNTPRRNTHVIKNGSNTCLCVRWYEPERVLGGCFLNLGGVFLCWEKISKKSDLKWLKKECTLTIYTKQKNPDLDPQSPAQSNLKVKDYRN